MPNKTTTVALEQEAGPAPAATAVKAPAVGQSAGAGRTRAPRIPRVRRAAPPAAPPPAPAPTPAPSPASSPAGTAAREAATPATPRTRRRSRPTRAPRPAPPPITLWGVGLSGVGALLALAGVLAMRPVETIADPWDPLRVAVYGLLVLGPAAIFWAMAQAFSMGRFWVYGTLAWAAFGYVLIFVAPPPPGQPITAAALAGGLALLFAALTAGLTLPLHALGWAVFTQRARRHDLRRAVRQAALLALFVVACLGMALFSVFNGLNALLLFVVLALAEFFFLSRD